MGRLEKRSKQTYKAFRRGVEGGGEESMFIDCFETRCGGYQEERVWGYSYRGGEARGSSTHLTKTPTDQHLMEPCQRALTRAESSGVRKKVRGRGKGATTNAGDGAKGMVEKGKPKQVVAERFATRDTAMAGE